MIHHIVMWKFKEEIREEDKERLKKDMAAHLEALVGQVPGLKSAEFISAPLSSSTHDMALAAVLERPEDVAVYGGHPAHVAVADKYVRPYVCQRACLDYEE